VATHAEQVGADCIDSLVDRDYDEAAPVTATANLVASTRERGIDAYRAELAPRVIDPLGLTDTSFPTAPGVPPPTTGAIVETGTGEGARFTWEPVCVWAARAMISTPMSTSSCG
jgi:hypothetical protein